MTTEAMQRLIGMALIDRDFCEEFLNGGRAELVRQFDLSEAEREMILATRASSIQELAVELREWLTDQQGPPIVSGSHAH